MRWKLDAMSYTCDQHVVGFQLRLLFMVFGKVRGKGE